MGFLPRPQPLTRFWYNQGAHGAQTWGKAVNRFQIIAGRWLAFIILPAAFWGGVALLFF